jgi:hypothetical protein
MNNRLVCCFNLQYFTEKISLMVSNKTCIREVLGTNLDRDTGYIDSFVVVVVVVILSCFSGQMFERNLGLERPLLSRSFSIHWSVIHNSALYSPDTDDVIK